MLGYKLIQTISSDFGKDKDIKYIDNLISRPSLISRMNGAKGDLAYWANCIRDERLQYHIVSAFEWRYTKEGHEYWRDIEEKYW